MNHEFDVQLRVPHMADAVTARPSPSASERKPFSAKADELGAVLDKLRPGTGAAITWLLCEAYTEGAKDMRERAERLLSDEAKHSAYAAELISSIRQLPHTSDQRFDTRRRRRNMPQAITRLPIRQMYDMMREQKPDPILTPDQWHDLCSEIGRLVERNGLFNVREALDTFKVTQKPK